MSFDNTGSLGVTDPYEDEKEVTDTFNSTLFRNTTLNYLSLRKSIWLRLANARKMALPNLKLLQAENSREFPLFQSQKQSFLKISQLVCLTPRLF